MEYDPNKRTNLKGVKAYRNNTFISSREARPIRIQCELEEPGIRLNKLGVEHMVTFFGSARLKPNHPDYIAAYHIANKLGTSPNMSAEIGISSGGGPGIMEAVNKGAHDAGVKSIGMGISLPFEQCNNEYITEDLDFEFHYFFTRKYWCVYLSKAFVIMPGGVGTMDELFEILTLIQTKKMGPKPIVLYNSKFWSNVVNFDAMIEHGTISAEDTDLLKITDDINEACDYIWENINLASHPVK